MNITKEKALEILNKDKFRNISLINLINDNNYKSLEQHGEFVLLRRNNKSSTLNISSGSEQSLNTLLKAIKKDDKHFSAIEDYLKEEIIKNKEIEYDNGGFKLCLPDDVKIPKVNNTEIRPLTKDDAVLVDSKWPYRGDESIEYVRSRIENGVGYGIDDNNGELVAWCLTHGDSSMGFMYVMEGYRNKGYAFDISLKVINHLREIGKIPFVHIIRGNTKSLNLAKKLGFYVVSEVNWFKLK